MRFYYENGMGDEGLFSEKDLIKAIYTAWNIEANLYIVADGTKIKNLKTDFFKKAKLVFAPWEENEFNNDMLREYGYCMEDDDLGEYRIIREIKTGKQVYYDWDDVKQLV